MSLFVRHLRLSTFLGCFPLILSVSCTEGQTNEHRTSRTALQGFDDFLVAKQTLLVKAAEIIRGNGAVIGPAIPPNWAH
jgi:hypothetical protein